MNENTDEATNRIIPLLIKDSKEITNSLTKRIQVNGILNEFNKTQNDNFDKLVNLSQIRYKSIKGGKNLEDVLKQQKKTYIKFAEQVNDNDLFNNIDQVDEEKIKLHKNLNRNKNKEINDLRDKLRASTRDVSRTEQRIRNKLNAMVKTHRQQFLNTDYNSTNKNTTSSNLRQRTQTPQKTLTEERQEFLQKLITEDSNYVNKNLGDYHRLLNVMKEESVKNGEIKIDKNSLNAAGLSTEKFNFLTFVDNKPQAVSKKDDHDEVMDINKLMRYTKKGKEMLKRLHFFNSNINYNKNTETDSSAYGKNPNEDYNFGNTVSVIKTEASKCLYLDEAFEQKREIFDNIFRTTQLPNLEDYENNILSKAKINIDTEGRDDKQNLNLRQITGKRKIGEDFRRIYNRKKKKWSNEDKEIEDERRMEQIKLIEINNFLTSIRLADRRSQLYIDGYSMREGQTNKEIKEFNSSLKKNYFYNKKKLNRKLGRFIIQKEELKKERENKINAEMQKQREEEVERKIKTQQAFEEYKQKIKLEAGGSDESIALGVQEVVPESIMKVSQPNKEEEYNNFLILKENYIKHMKEKSQNERKNKKDLTCYNIHIQSRPSYMQEPQCSQLLKSSLQLEKQRGSSSVHLKNITAFKHYDK